jgi:signal recognition particle subunit SRP19
MARKKDRHLVLYPEYFTAKFSRTEGRRVPKKLAKPSPTVEDIEKAAKDLGLNPVVEKDKSYPRFWYKKRGRVLVEGNIPKTEMIESIARALPKSGK